ncbi:MAG: ATP-binding protein [Desulfobacterales bacterium]|jgi:hypothetical protein|nr:ATP-binding protein [Desulfobacterales bacterium]
MVALVLPESEDLFFDSLVCGHVKNPRFVRRDWLAKALDAKLDEPGKRFVLLTAEPGAGKSAFLAQLAHQHPEWLRYFIRRDQRAVLADVSDKSLLLRIGYQLAARRPELFGDDQGRLSVAVEQHFDTVAEHGEAVGVAVKRLLDSPFRQKLLTVVQHVRSTQGKVVGLQVDELVREPSLMKAADLFLLALITPAQALQRSDPSQRIVILIDALDEIRFQAVTENVLAWLTNCPELPENVRFVLSSRPPDEALDLFRTKQAERLAELAIAEDDKSVKQDVSTFVARLAGEPAITRALRQAQGGAPAFVEKATDKAHGNLGYVDALARGIDRALAQKNAKTLDALLSVKELPADLDGLYDFFLRQIKASVGRERIELKDPETGETYDKAVWPAVYHPILGVLAVAMEPLDLELLMRLGGIRAERVWVSDALDRLLQFLDLRTSRYRLYHATVAEFLTADKTRDNPDPKTAALYQDARLLHEQIVFHYGASKDHWRSVDWNEVDTYGLMHLASHLSALQSDAGYRVRLYELVTGRVAVAKWERFGSLVSFGKDLATAMASAARETPLNWADFMRCYLIEQILSSQDPGADVVRFIAACIQECGAPADTRKIIDRMLESASVIRSPSEKAGALSATAAFLFQVGYVEEARSVVHRAFDEAASIENIQEKSETLSTIVLDIATILDHERAKDIARRALAMAQSSNFAWSKAISISEVAYALAKIGDEALANEAFSMACNAAWDVHDPDDRAYALCAVAAAMDRAGDEKGAESLFRDATAQLYAWSPPEEVEDEYRAIYVDYRARSGRDLDTLFSIALEIKDRNQRQAALRSLAARLAKAVLDGDYPHGSRCKRNVDRLCDREVFLSIAAEDAPTSASGEATLTLRALCEAIVECAPQAQDRVL